MTFMKFKLKYEFKEIFHMFERKDIACDLIKEEEAGWRPYIVSKTAYIDIVPTYVTPHNKILLF